MSIRTYTKDMSYIKLRTPSNVEQLLLYESHSKKTSIYAKRDKNKIHFASEFINLARLSFL